MILCVDQLEDVYNLDDAEGPVPAARWPRLCDLVSRIPTAVVVIACLQDFYETLKAKLTTSITDRIEKRPGARSCSRGPCDEDEVVPIVAQTVANSSTMSSAPRNPARTT